MKLSRRAVLLGGAAFLPRLGAAARIHEVRVISQRPSFYHGWPTLARRRNGELLVVSSGGREAHVWPFGWVELMRSRDDGRTWSWPEVLMDTAIDDRDAGVCETAQGSILVTTFTSLAYEPLLEKTSNVEAWQAAHRRLDAAQRNAMLGTWMIRSAGGGATWSAPYRVPVNSPHGPIQLHDGRLLYAGKELWTEERRNGVAESADDGRTWRWLAAIPTRPRDNQRDYHELHAVEMAKGALIVHIRNHNKANERETLQSESTDGGKTWTTPHPIGVWGLPSHLLRLRDGRLLMSYGHRRRPFGNHARLSADDGRTWSEPMSLSEDGAGGDLGYPSTVELGDGALLTVWYELLAGSTRAVLRQARWSIA
ncbi:MAG: sialidase family protein, partial [Dongiaceae bacterium]